MIASAGPQPLIRRREQRINLLPAQVADLQLGAAFARGKRGLNTLLTRVAPQTLTTGRSSANPTRQVVPSPGSMVAVRWLMRTMVPTV